MSFLFGTAQRVGSEPRLTTVGDDNSEAETVYKDLIEQRPALLDEKPKPTDEEIKSALSDLICRCGTHGAAFRAVKRVVEGS